MPGRRRKHVRRATALFAGVAVLAAAVLVGASFLPGGGGDMTVTTPGELDPSVPPASCPVTIPAGDFVPPERYHSGFDAGPGEDREWYGSEDLWTILDADGEVWRPHYGRHGNPKLFLWSVHQGSALEEQRPDVKLTAERVDGEAPMARNDRTTHGFVGSNLFMITSIVLPTPGCWEVTADYRGASLGWVIWASGPTSASPADSSAAPDRSAFADPALAGLCEETDVDIAAEEPAAPTTEEAIERFVADNSVLEETTIEGFQIRFEGQVVGRLTVRAAPAGGYYVAQAEWCYPEPDGS